MKKILFLATISLLSTLSVAAFADNRFDVEGKIRLGSGKEIVRIDIGKGNRNLPRRVSQLERAVRELQQQVYRMKYRSNRSEKWACKVKTFGTTYYGYAHTRMRAEQAAVEKCEKAGSHLFCDNEMKCFKE